MHVAGLSLQSQQARGVEHIVPRQVAAAELAVPGERLPPVQDTPVVYEQGLQEQRGGHQQGSHHGQHPLAGQV